MKKDENAADEPTRIGDRAIDNLQFIRETMERSTSFTAVPGYGGILMGATACVAAYMANKQASPQDWLSVWLVEAGLALAIGMLAMWQKSKIAGQSLVSAPAMKFARSFVPPLLAGGFITLGVWGYGQHDLLPPIWMLTYGAAVVCGGAFSARVVPVMGWCFMALGAIAFALPASYGNLMMAASFGLLHIIFGAIIAKRYGG